MLGNHPIVAWSRVQTRIALTELYAGLRGISETLGFVLMMRQLHTHKTGVVSVIAWMHVRVVPSCSDVVVENSSISPSNLCGFKKQFVSI